jgi:hypothetical protein
MIYATDANVVDRELVRYKRQPKRGNSNPALFDPNHHLPQAFDNQQQLNGPHQANRSQVHWRLVVTRLIDNAGGLSSSSAIGKAPRKQLAAKSARKTATTVG